MLGKGVEQHLDNCSLGLAVDLGDEIVGSLLGNRDDVEVLCRAVDDVAGAARGFHRDVEHGMHKSRIRDSARAPRWKLRIVVNNIDPLKNIRVVLSRPNHPGNIGATARALKTMGLGALYLVSPRQFPHPDADARASGAVDVLRRAQVCDSLAAALEGCVLAVATSSRQRELRHEMMTARDAARALSVQAASHPVALVFGNETSGLTSEEASLCQVWAYIPSDDAYASLNLASAVQIFAYEVRMASSEGSWRQTPEFEPASLEQVEQLYQQFAKTTIAIGFLDPANPKRLLPRLRRLLARARLENEEVNILRGFLKAVDKLRR